MDKALLIWFCPKREICLKRLGQIIQEKAASLNKILPD